MIGDMGVWSSRERSEAKICIWRSITFGWNVKSWGLRGMPRESTGRGVMSKEDWALGHPIVQSGRGEKDQQRDGVPAGMTWGGEDVGLGVGEK